MLFSDLKRVFLLHLYMRRIEKRLVSVEIVIPNSFSYRGKHKDVFEEAARKLSRQYPKHSFRYYDFFDFVILHVKYSPRDQRGFYKEKR
jgi:hypothetical protein